VDDRTSSYQGDRRSDMKEVKINGMKVYIVGNSMYARCSDCGSLVKLNKFFVGSLHVCV
jgi:hypothetical protein